MCFQEMPTFISESHMCLEILFIFFIYFFFLKGRSFLSIDIYSCIAENIYYPYFARERLHVSIILSN
jgi:hypothetical protein